MVETYRRVQLAQKLLKFLRKNLVWLIHLDIFILNEKAVTWSRSNVGTGNNSSTYDMVGTRIERFYISKLICTSVTSFDTLPCTFSDHSFIRIKLATNSGINIGKSYWKLNEELLEDENFLGSFEYFWKLISRTDNVTLNWWDYIKEQIKLFCIDYSKSRNRNKFGEFKKNLRRNLIIWIYVLFQIFIF